MSLVAQALHTQTQVTSASLNEVKFYYSNFKDEETEVQRC